MGWPGVVRPEVSWERWYGKVGGLLREGERGRAVGREE